MSETENNYVATATAEKRLREVLADRLPETGADHIAQILLDGAEITYLPRKKSVSILLRVPETAPTLKRQDPDPSLDGRVGSDGLTKSERDSGVVVDDPAPDVVELPPDTPADAAKRAARFGQFAPVDRAATPESEEEYFAG